MLSKVHIGISIVISALTGYIISQIIALDIAIFSGVSLLFISLCISALTKIKKLNNKINEQNYENEGLRKRIAGEIDEGERLFYMAMTQDVAEPLRYELLKESVEKHKNHLAALILGGYYKYGVFLKNNEEMVKSQPKVTNSIYSKCRHNDPSGTISWCLGWQYEEEARVSDNPIIKYKKRNIAYKLYNQSAKKGFGKGYNSLGKFIDGGLSKDAKKIKDSAIGYYETGYKAGDIYALVNCGNFHKKEYKNHDDNSPLDKAVYFYKLAATQGNTEACMKLAIMYKDHSTYFSKNSKEIALLYIKAISVSNQYGAISYYKLGDLLSSYKELQDDPEIVNAIKKDSLDSDEDIVITCYIKSYNMFYYLSANEKSMSKLARECYKELTERFKNKTIAEQNT